MASNHEESARRAAVFVDGAYLGLRTNKIRGKGQRIQVDIEKMSDELVGSYSRLRTYYYNTLPSDDKFAEAIERFHAGLRLANRIEVRLGKTMRTPKGEKDRQKQVDILLALDMFKLASSGKINLAILLSGDGDFVPVLQAVKEEGVLTKVIYSRESIDHELRLVADMHHEIGAADFRRWQLRKSRK